MMATAFDNSAAWCTKQGWHRWHFYINSTLPLCGALEFNLLDDGDDVMVLKCRPTSAACETCIGQGERAGLWHDAPKS